ncbi:MAG: hypothetical protein JWP01_956 [Myxococcales bacterium]|nr:hypothetical protein [Myxococcales bacterium]
MARSRDFLLIPLTLTVTVMGLLWGGRNSYVSLRNRAPHELTCAELIARPPDSEWVRLRDCVPDYDHMGVETQTRKHDTVGRVTTVFIPLHAVGAPRMGDNKLVVAITEGAMLDLGERYPSDATFEYATEQLTQRFEGMVELGVDRSERDRSELRGLGMELGSEFSIVEHDARPRPLWLSLGVLAVGGAGLLLIGRRLRRWLRNGPVPLAKATIVRE